MGFTGTRKRASALRCCKPPHFDVGPSNPMNRLLEVGFVPAGHWLLESDKLQYVLTRHSTQKNILYAFVCDGDVKYVGKTIRSLSQRMSGYKSPGPTQSTNVGNHRRIRELLSKGTFVEIYALPDNGLLHYGQFHLNLAAALEDSIIRVVDPEWNGGKPEQIVPAPSSQAASPEPDAMSEEQIPSETFLFVLHSTYFASGFFNVGVASSASFGADGETIELFLGENPRPVLGTINRRATSNGSARIMGGIELRKWFQNNAAAMSRIAVEVISPTSIRLRVANPTDKLS